MSPDAAEELAKRIVRALALAETIPREEWQNGYGDRVALREIRRMSQLNGDDGFKVSFYAQVAWVRNLIQGNCEQARTMEQFLNRTEKGE